MANQNPHALTFAVHAAQAALRICKALLCSETEQPLRLSKIHWAATPLLVHGAQVEQRFCIALCCLEAWVDEHLLRPLRKAAWRLLDDLDFHVS